MSKDLNFTRHFKDYSLTALITTDTKSNTTTSDKPYIERLIADKNFTYIVSHLIINVIGFTGVYIMIMYVFRKYFFGSPPNRRYSE